MSCVFRNPRGRGEARVSSLHRLQTNNRPHSPPPLPEEGCVEPQLEEAGWDEAARSLFTWGWISCTRVQCFIRRHLSQAGRVSGWPTDPATACFRRQHGWPQNGFEGVFFCDFSTVLIFQHQILLETVVAFHNQTPSIKTNCDLLGVKTKLLFHISRHPVVLLYLNFVHSIALNYFTASNLGAQTSWCVSLHLLPKRSSLQHANKTDQTEVGRGSFNDKNVYYKQGTNKDLSHKMNK